MAGKTCAACDYELDSNLTRVEIGGKTVEVCCEDCAQLLKRGPCVRIGREPGKELPMSSTLATVSKRKVATPSGSISYRESGSGPVALFVHGVLLNGDLWRHQLEEFSDVRRCIAVDLLGHGDTEIEPDQDVSVTANAIMIREFLDALHIEQVDLVGNDSGGGIAQIFAASNPSRVRSFALTNCDAHNNWPPEAFKPFLAMAAAGGLRGALEAMLSDKDFYRSLRR